MDRPRDPGTGGGPALASPDGAAAGPPAKRSEPDASSPPRWRRALARVRRFLEPPRKLRPTRAGWWFFAISLGVGFAALNTGNNLLYLVLALMLSFLVLSGVLSEAALRGIAVEREVPREIYAGRAATIGLRIHNVQRRVTAYAVLVEDRQKAPGGAAQAAGRAFALQIDAGRSVRVPYRFTPERRGPIEFTEFQVFTRFPFGLFSKALTLPAPGRTLVYPAIEALSVPDAFGAARERGDGLAGDRGQGALAEGLREYAPGDSARRVHWPASLRRNELVVRELENERRPEVEVRLRTDVEPGPGFERAICWAASEIAALLDDGARVALRTTTRHFDADTGDTQRARLMTFLATVQAGEPAQERAA